LDFSGRELEQETEEFELDGQGAHAFSILEASFNVLIRLLQLIIITPVLDALWWRLRGRLPFACSPYSPHTGHTKPISISSLCRFAVRFRLSVNPFGLVRVAMEWLTLGLLHLHSTKWEKDEQKDMCAFINSILPFCRLAVSHFSQLTKIDSC